MKNLYTWQKVTLIIMMIVSFIAGLQSSIVAGGLQNSSIIIIIGGAVMTLAINTLILYGILIAGNFVYKKIRKNKNG